MVWKQLKKSYNKEDMRWIKDVEWNGPIEVPLDQINFSTKKTWKAHHEPELVKSKETKIKNGKREKNRTTNNARTAA